MQKDSNKYTKTYTFSRSPSAAQIISYIIITLDTFIFYFIVQTSIINENVRITLFVLYSVSLLTTIISTLICSCIDPSDEVMVAFKNNHESFNSVNINNLLYCDYCVSYVQISARHCRECHRCVEDFDHHCMWINNCIGRKNYRYFLFMITSTFINLAIFIASVSFLTYENQWRQFLPIVISSWITLAIVCIVQFLLLNLILLHIYLSCKSYTTYQFIVARREQQKRQNLIKSEQQYHKRKQALLKIEEEKRNKQKRPVLLDEEIKVPSSEKVQEEKYSSNKQIISNKVNQIRVSRSNSRNQELSLSHCNSIAENQSKKSQQLTFNKNQLSENVIFGDPNQSDMSQAGKTGFAWYQKNKNSSTLGSTTLIILDDKNKEVNDRYKQGSNQRMISQNSDESIRISQFFTRNKSFSFLLSNQIAERPHKHPQNNISLQLQQVNEPNYPNTSRNKTKKKTETNLNQNLKKKIMSNDKNFKITK